MAVSRYFDDQVHGMPSRPSRTFGLRPRQSFGTLMIASAFALFLLPAANPF